MTNSNYPKIYSLSERSSCGDMEAVAEAVAKEVLRGNLAAIPTETVYGLAVDASLPQAVEKIYAIKGRDPLKPLSWHIGSLSQLPKACRDLIAHNPKIKRLTDAFWPGPLTLVLPLASGQTMGVRYPQHPFFLALSKAVGKPMFATSANISGQKSPTSFSAIDPEILAKVAVAVDAGATQQQVDSTVLDLAGSQPRILRLGAVSEEELNVAAGGLWL